MFLLLLEETVDGAISKTLTAQEDTVTHSKRFDGYSVAWELKTSKERILKILKKSQVMKSWWNLIDLQMNPVLEYNLKSKLWKCFVYSTGYVPYT